MSNKVKVECQIDGCWCAQHDPKPFEPWPTFKWKATTPETKITGQILWSGVISFNSKGEWIEVKGK